MQSCRQSSVRAGAMLTELFIVVAVLALLLVLAGYCVSALFRAKDESRRIRCRNNLNQIAKGMATYISEHGGP
ncbi:MAG: prepilin-type cleavage/methylation domain-containing protein, partial [bacterium]|nr:prepilin-type cleavage/methylation domain-containing protein [bacterium]